MSQNLNVCFRVHLFSSCLRWAALPSPWSSWPTPARAMGHTSAPSTITLSAGRCNTWEATGGPGPWTRSPAIRYKMLLCLPYAYYHKVNPAMNCTSACKHLVFKEQFATDYIEKLRYITLKENYYTTMGGKSHMWYQNLEIFKLPGRPNHAYTWWYKSPFKLFPTSPTVGSMFYI